MTYELVLANKTYSGWGLRVWLLFKHFLISFEHSVVPLYGDQHHEFMQAEQPARQFPTLIVTLTDTRHVIWDSLAITEYLSDVHQENNIWPRELMARAAASSLCAEMHSGFKALRTKMPVNLERCYRTFRPDADTRADIDRVRELWAWARERFPSGGPYLFGQRFTAADAFFAPVAARFQTYSIPLAAHEQQYCNLLLGHPATMEYVEDAVAEPWVLEHNEFSME